MRHTVLRQPIGAGRGVLALEFPDELAVAQGRRRAVGRLLDHPQGVGGDAGRRRAARARLPDAGLPPGVLNLVFGEPSKISEYLIPHPSIRLVTFTGSIPVGKQLAGDGRRST